MANPIKAFSAITTVQILTTMIVAAGPALSGAAAASSQTGVSRTDLQRHDLSVAGREVIQARVDIAPGATAARHSHPGEETIYVLKGTLEYQLDGRPAVTLRAGDILFVPYGVIHTARNIGNDEGSELATYVVEKGKPLLTPAP